VTARCSPAAISETHVRTPNELQLCSGCEIAVQATVGALESGHAIRLRDEDKTQ
jgi:hypothetical protein